jgi:hypothetical protein
MPTDLAGSGSIDRQREAIHGKATICRARCLFNLGRHGHRKATCPYETPGQHGHLRCGKATIRRRQATCPSGSVGRQELVKYGMSTTLNRSVTNQCRHVERRIVYGNNDRLDCHSTISVQPFLGIGCTLLLRCTISRSSCTCDSHLPHPFICTTMYTLSLPQYLLYPTWNQIDPTTSSTICLITSALSRPTSSTSSWDTTGVAGT